MSENTEFRIGERRPGGRAAKVRNDVLHAAAALLSEVGYDKMGIEDVAARAGVHKTTVYRRWRTKAELVADATTQHTAEVIPIPDTGSLLTDLRALARSIVAEISSETGARRARSVVAAAAGSDELTAVVHEFWSHRLRLASAIVERGVARGDLPAHTDADLIIESLIGPLWVRLLLTGEHINNNIADRTAELIAAGATNSHAETTPRASDGTAI